MAGTAAGHADAAATDVNDRCYIGRRTQVERAQARGEGGLAEPTHWAQNDSPSQDDRAQEHGAKDHGTQEHGT